MFGSQILIPAVLQFTTDVRNQTVREQKSQHFFRYVKIPKPHYTSLMGLGFFLKVGGRMNIELYLLSDLQYLQFQTEVWWKRLDLTQLKLILPKMNSAALHLRGIFPRLLGHWKKVALLKK